MLPVKEPLAPSSLASKSTSLPDDPQKPADEEGDGVCVGVGRLLPVEGGVRVFVCGGVAVRDQVGVRVLDAPLVRVAVGVAVRMGVAAGVDARDGVGAE